MASPTVRTATPRDAPAIARILERSYPVLMAPAYEARLLLAALPLIIRPNPRLLASGTYYLAELDGEAAGCGGWTREEPGSRRVVAGSAHLRHFAVASRWTGLGVGRLLYETCAAAARAAGVGQFDVFASLNAEPFYGALGFEPVRPIAVPLGNGLSFPSVHMRRAI
jgi:GNAT superfamily N-acetyltransferase